MSRVVKKPLERRSEIIDAAHELFQKKGYDKVTMQDVMNRLDIAKGTIYHYFRSKEQLLEAVIDKISEKMMSQMQAAMDQTKGNALDGSNTYEDECVGNTLYEGECAVDWDLASYWAVSVPYDCPNGCFNGACLPTKSPFDQLA